MFPTVILKNIFSTDLSSWWKKTNKTKHRDKVIFISSVILWFQTHKQTVKSSFHLPFVLCLIWYSYTHLLWALQSYLIETLSESRGEDWKTEESQKQRNTQTWTPSCTERPVESDVKEALDLGLRALIHHLITSAVCACVCTLTFVYAYCLMFAYVQ